MVMSVIACLQQSDGKVMHERIVCPMNASLWKSPSSISGLVGGVATAFSALVFVLHHSLNQAEWVVLMVLAIVGFCGTGIAAWMRSLWWLLGTLFSLLLIIGLVGAVAG